MSRVPSDYHVTLEHVAEWGHFPFGPACQGRSAERPYGRSAAALLRRFRHTFVPYPYSLAWGGRRPRLAAYPLLTLALRRVFTRHTT